MLHAPTFIRRAANWVRLQVLCDDFVAELESVVDCLMQSKDMNVVVDSLLQYARVDTFSLYSEMESQQLRNLIACGCDPFDEQRRGCDHTLRARLDVDPTGVFENVKACARAASAYSAVKLRSAGVSREERLQRELCKQDRDAAAARLVTMLLKKGVKQTSACLMAAVSKNWLTEHQRGPAV